MIAVTRNNEFNVNIFLFAVYYYACYEIYEICKKVFEQWHYQIWF